MSVSAMNCGLSSARSATTFKRRSGKPQRKNFCGLPAPIYDQLRSIDKGQPHALPDPSGALMRFRVVNI